MSRYPGTVTNPIRKPKIYFITDGEFIKIGITSGSLRTKISVIKAHNPRNLEVLFVIDDEDEDMVELEKTLHRRFENCNIGGEWFSAAPELLEFIKQSKTWGWSK